MELAHVVHELAYVRVHELRGRLAVCEALQHDRWMLSLQNIVIYGVLFIVVCLAIGLLLAVFIDQKVVGEGALRTVFLYPYAMSFVATGLVWQWILNPQLGIQEVLHRIGFTHARFDWIATRTWPSTRRDRVLWHSSGLVMAILLAGCAASTKRIGRQPASMAFRAGATTSASCAATGAGLRNCGAARGLGGQALRRCRRMTKAGRATPPTCRPNSSWTICSSARTSGWPRPHRRRCWSPWLSSLRPCSMRAAAASRLRDAR